LVIPASCRRPRCSASAVGSGHPCTAGVRTADQLRWDGGDRGPVQRQGGGAGV